MALKLITPPAPAVTWAEAKLHLRIDTDEEQTLVEGMIAAATGWIDGRNGWLGRAIMTQQWDLMWDQFPCGPIEIPLPPLQSVDGVFYTDEDGAEQEVEAASYVVDADSLPGWVVPSGSWPSTMTTANAVRIRFTAGYDVVPPAIRAAILLIVGHLYASRDENTDMPRSAEFLLQPYKVWRL